jgi:hypothetical protein
MKRAGLILLALVTWGSMASAEYYEREGSYLYKVTPYKELWTKVEGIKITSQVATQVLGSVIESMQNHKILPQGVMTRNDLEKFRRAQKEVDGLVDYLNEFVREQRARGGKFEPLDLVPDALILFGGKKFSFAIGQGAGISGTVGLVLMPVMVEKFDTMTGKMVHKGPSLRSSIVVWPTADAGFGLGGGPRLRVGIAAVWDLNDALTNPSQIWGAGMGTSWSPITVVGGVNVKAGFLSNWKMPGWVDFAYAAAAIEVGAVAEVGTPRINLTTMISGPAFMSMFDKSYEAAYNEVLREMARSLDRLMEETRQQEEKRGENKEENKEEKKEEKREERKRQPRDDRQSPGTGNSPVNTPR